MEEVLDEKIKRRLQANGTTLRRITQNVLQDLAELGRMLLALETLDAASFLGFVETASILSKCARRMFRKVFKLATDRVFFLNTDRDVNPQEDRKRKAQSAAAGKHAISQCKILLCDF